MEKISWTDREDKEVLQGAMEERNIQQTAKRRQTGFFTFCVGSEGKTSKKIVSRNWMTLRKRKYTVN
jgi:hypothetical protein